jgi:hypothetical protein
VGTLEAAGEHPEDHERERAEPTGAEAIGEPARV